MKFESNDANLKTDFNEDKPVLGFPFFLSSFFFFGDTRKKFELFLREQLSRKRTHNKQKKKHCSYEQCFFFAFFAFPTRKVQRKSIKSYLGKDFSGGEGEIRFAFRVRLPNLKSEL